jgi:hypothetical protein
MGYENEKEKKSFNMLKNNATYMLFLYLKHPPPLFSTMHKTQTQKLPNTRLLALFEAKQKNLLLEYLGAFKWQNFQYQIKSN